LKLKDETYFAAENLKRKFMKNMNNFTFRCISYSHIFSEQLTPWFKLNRDKILYLIYQNLLLKKLKLKPAHMRKQPTAVFPSPPPVPAVQKQLMAYGLSSAWVNNLAQPSGHLFSRDSRKWPAAYLLTSGWARSPQTDDQAAKLAQLLLPHGPILAHLSTLHW
jgi:hypothetical protein